MLSAQNTKNTFCQQDLISSSVTLTNCVHVDLSAKPQTN